MANTKSAEKRIKINKRNKLKNRSYKSAIKTKIKFFFVTLKTYKVSQLPETKVILQNTLSSIYSLIDKATKKKVFHKNLAAKKKSKLAHNLKSV